MAQELTYVEVRDKAVFIGQLAQALTVEQIDEAIRQAQRAESVGPVLDPTAWIRGSGELAKQVRYLHAFRDFRAAVDEIVATVGA